MPPKYRIYEDCRTRYLMPVYALFSAPGDKSVWAAIAIGIKGVVEVIGETLAIDPMFAVAVLFAIVADFITGKLAAKKRGEKITSWGYRQTTIKAIEYALFIFLFVAIDRALFGQQIITYGAVGWVLRTEAKSVTENVFTEGQSSQIMDWLDGQMSWTQDTESESE